MRAELSGSKSGVLRNSDSLGRKQLARCGNSRAGAARQCLRCSCSSNSSSGDDLCQMREGGMHILGNIFSLKVVTYRQGIEYISANNHARNMLSAQEHSIKNDKLS